MDKKKQNKGSGLLREPEKSSEKKQKTQPKTAENTATEKKTNPNDRSPAPSATNPPLNKQDQRNDQLASVNDKSGQEKAKPNRPPIWFRSTGDAPGKARSTVGFVLKNLVYASGQVQDFLTFVQKNGKCDLDINLSAAKAEDHGSTGIYILDPTAEDGYVLLQEAFLTRPELIADPQRFRVEINIAAGLEAPGLEGPTTLLHELELHAAHAGRLIMNLARQGAGEDRLELVLAFMRQPDDHLNLDHHEQFLRTAARLRQEVEPGLRAWASEVLKFVVSNATLELLKALKKSPDGSVQDALWLEDLSELLTSRGDADVVAKPRPQVIGTPGVGQPAVPRAKDVDPDAVLDYLADKMIEEKAGLLDILHDARTRLGYPVSKVLEVYRDKAIPTLLSSASQLVTEEDRLAYLEDCGVPRLLAFAAIDKASSKSE